MRKLLLLFVASLIPVQAAIAFVNAQAAGNDSVTSVATAGISHSSGNQLYVTAKFREACGSITMSIANTAMDTFTQIGSLLDNTNLTCQGQWYVKNSAGNGSDVVTLTISQSVRFPNVSVVQVSGEDTGTPLDATATGTEIVDGVATTGAFTTSTANQIIICGGNSYGSSSPFVPDTGYTLPSGSVDGFTATIAIEYKIVSAIQTGVTASIDGSSGGTIISIMCATFKEASSTSNPVKHNSGIF